MGVEKNVYSFRLEEEVVQKIKEYAQSENRNFSNMVETILKNYISEREKEN
jgi:predicted DNA-binding protein